MALDLGAIRAALAAQIRSRVDREVNVYGGYLPDAPEPPCVLVEGDPDGYVTPHQTYSRSGVVIVRFRLRVFTPPGPGVDGQMALDEFLSIGTDQINSVFDAIWEDRTLGGTVTSDTKLEGMEWLGRVELGRPGTQTVLADGASLIVTAYTQPTT